jgi:hypothetical protein
MNPSPNLTPQHHHLMSKRDVFRLKSALRLEWQDQNGIDLNGEAKIARKK